MSAPSRFALLVAVLATLLAGGCGIPDNSTVVPVGPGPARDQSSGDDSTLVKPSRTDTQDRATFVANYLTAAAGDYDSAIDAVKKFMSPELAATFKPTQPDLKVIRVDGSPLVNPDEPRVTVDAEMVGTLDGAGVLTPASTPEKIKYEIDVGTVEGQSGLFVTGVKQNWLLLSATALSGFYAKRTIYFWNTDHTGLVPDVRYMPQSVPSEQQPTEVVGWLIGGPSSLIKGVAESLPPDTRSIGNVTAVSNDTLQISLSGQALPDDLTPAERQEALTRLQEQLRWSLRPNMRDAATLELNIEHQPTQTYGGADYLTANAAYRTVGQPQRFVVYDGQVRRLSRSYRASDPIPVVPPAANRSVRMAAFGASATRDYAALVVNESQGRPTLRAGSAAIGDVAALGRLRLANPIGRPVWAVSPPVGKADGTVGLVPAGGRLYWFAPDGRSAAVVAWPGGPGAITTVSVAPDARRIALIAGGRLYLATFSNDDGVQMSPPVPIQTQMTHLTGVDWSAEGTLVVSGTKAASGRSAIMDVSIDGAEQTDRLADLGEATVSYLVAVPASPTENGELGVPVAYTLGTSAAYDESSANKLDVKDLAQPVANPRAGAASPTAPAFLG
jgi:hypothetical protein